VEPRKKEKRESKDALEPREGEPRPRRFRIVKLEERIAPLAGGGSDGVPSGKNC
jgi:hypothetical protein